MSVSLNEVVRLQCPEASRLAQRRWKRPNSRLSPDLYLQQDDGSLRFLATPITLGHYLCLSVENGFEQLLAAYQVKQKSSGGGGAGGLTTSQPANGGAPRATQSRRPAGGTPSPTLTAWGPRRTEGKVGRGRGQQQPPPPTPSLSPRETAGVTPYQERNFTFWLNPPLPAGTDSKQGGRGGAGAATKGTSGGGGGGEGGVLRGSDGGEHQLQTNTPCYLQELVVVSVLLVLCLSVLLTLGLYSVRQRCRSRTAPQACARRDAERGGGGGGGGNTAGAAATPQEREALKGSPRETKRNGQSHNGQAHNGGKSPVTLCNGSAHTASNGHLPNTPI